MVSGCKIGENDSRFAQPYVLAEGSHWFAIYKPPFWEVSIGSDGIAGVATGASMENEGDAILEQEQCLEKNRQKLKMQNWMQQHFASHYLICKDSTEGFGLMHRLDV